MKYCYDISKENDLDILTFYATTFIDGEYNGKSLEGNYSRENRLNSEVRIGEDFYNYAIANREYRIPVWLNFYKKSF